jgi:predicted XRE-type DNA-binding protein
MTNKTPSTRVRRSTGNVFEDLKVPQAGQALAKAEIARQIGKIIAKRRLTQVRASEVLGIDQPKVSALLRGQLSGFSTERLFRFLMALGRDIEIAIKPKPRNQPQGRIRVLNRAKTSTR